MPFSPGMNTLSSLITDACLLSPRKWEHLSNRGGSQLSNINNHYRRTSSFPIVVFTSAHGCFHYSEQNTWESCLLFVKLLTSGHRLEKSTSSGVPRIVMSLLTGFLVMVEKWWWGSIGLFLPSSSCLSTESCFPAVVRGAATCLADFSGRPCYCHPVPGGTPSLE